MVHRYAIYIASLAAAMLCAAGAAFGAQNISLTADEMYYDPQAGLVRAIGSVHIGRADGDLFAQEGTGTADGREFVLSGDVNGTFEDEEETVEITCAHLRMTTSGDVRTVTASGDAHLTRGDDFIMASELTWGPGRDTYSARGDVVGSMGSHSLAADDASRTGERFVANRVTHYEDESRGITLRANRAEGAIKGGEVVEVIARGRVEMTATNDAGEVTFVTGETAVYSVARGTLVVSGGAEVTRAGRVLNAGSVVYRLDDGRVEALERPTLTFAVE